MVTIKKNYPSFVNEYEFQIFPFNISISIPCALLCLAQYFYYLLIESGIGVIKFFDQKPGKKDYRRILCAVCAQNLMITHFM